MESPYGHNNTHRHHHQRNDQEEDQERPPHYPPPPSYDRPPHYRENQFEQPRPPPPYYQENEDFSPPPPHRQPYYQENQYAPPPTHETHSHHTTNDQQEFNYQEPPPPTQVSHVSHQGSGESETSHHSFMPHMPSFMHHHSSSAASDLSNKPTYKVFCKAQPNLSLTVREGKVVLAPSNSSDEFQQWYKHEKYSTRVKDEVGFPSFALVNKATCQAMKHAIGAGHPVQLVPYNPDVLDESILWSESLDIGDTYRSIRMVNNIRLNLDAFHDDKKSGVHDGTILGLWQWTKGDNQRWKIAPN